MPDGPPTADGGPQPATLRCPRCDATVAPEQDWCLECGAPARTRLAPTPQWRAPLAVLAVIVLACGIALALAFASLTKDDGVVRGDTAITATGDPNDTGAAAGSVPVPVPAASSATP